jgi:hypothetical protein
LTLELLGCGSLITLRPTNTKSWQNWFWHEETNRLRAFWRILLAFMIFMVIVRGTRFLVGLLTQAVLADTTPGDVLRLTTLLLVLWLMAKYVDKRPFSDYGLKIKQKTFWVNLGFGLLLGALLITAVFFIQYGLDWIVIIGAYVKSTPWPFAIALLFPLINLIAAVTFAELFFRGYLIVNIAESFAFLRSRYETLPHPGSSKIYMLRNNLYGQAPVLMAWFLATAFFLIYRMTTGMSGSVLLLNLIRASFLLTLPFILTHNLGVPIGLNLGWSFFASNIFGLRGTEFILTRTSVLSVLVKGPEYLTGGQTGPEAGLLAMIAFTLGGVVLMAWLRYQQKQAPPGFDPWYFEYKN